MAMANRLIRLAEIALRLMSKADKHQSPGVKLGLANGLNGICSQGNCVLIFKGD